MQKHFIWYALLLVFTGCSLPLMAQVTPPAAYSFTGKPNAVRTWTPFMIATDTAVVRSTSRTAAEVALSSEFFDGLGRPLQTVVRKATPDQKDMVSSMVYDKYGREQYQYLPYVSTGTNGQFKNSPYTERVTFMNTQYNSQEAIFYGEAEYESSPMNRVLKTYAPGNSWGKTNGNKFVENQYLLNTTTDSVVIWNITSGAIPTSGGYYAAGKLVKSVVKDESGNRVAEFKDKNGQVVLKRVEITASAPDGHTGWLSTYYAYDMLGSLRFVIPPLAVEAIKSNWIVTTDIANELCFFYRYDNLGRAIMKKVPGADSTEMVYDVRDRLVFSRDGNLKTKSTWMANFYDELNRPILTALYSSASTRPTLQSGLTGATSALTFSFTISGASESITVNNSLAGLTAGSLNPLTVSYYDGYTYNAKKNFDATQLAKVSAGSNPYSLSPTSYGRQTTGMVTGTKARILGGTTWLTTTSYYDDYGRVLQLIADNHVGGLETSTNQYDFSGKLLSNFLLHTSPKDTSALQNKVLTINEYDHGGRVLQVKKQLNESGTNKTTVTSTFDALSQLNTKTLGSSLETLTYAYNIRGWLTSMNKNYLTAVSTNYFGFELAYDRTASAISGTTYNAAQYNGNIGGMIWRASGDGAKRRYDFSYDKANRLMKADFTQFGSTWTNATVDYSVKMGNGTTPSTAYDANGNIKAMVQRGLKAGANATLDNLVYNYNTNSNKLKYVRDSANDISSTLGDFKEPTANNTANISGTADYSYNVNGSMRTDANKDIDSIAYNHLNLVESVHIKNKGSIEYQYDANGIKLKKTVRDSTGTPVKVSVTDYVMGFTYQNDTLQFFGHEEGRIRAVRKTGQPLAYTYDYFVKDHLGNTRVLLTEQTDFTMYAATMETESSAVENALFSNVDATRAEAPSGYPEKTANNTSVARLNAKDEDRKIGPSLVLKVMPGDTIRMGVKAFYKSSTPLENDNLAPDMLPALLRAFGDGVATAEKGAASEATGLPFNRDFTTNQYKRLKNKQPAGADRPRAYLNYVLFNEQMEMVEQNSGVKQVAAEPDKIQALAKEEMVAESAGYLYVYTSNESLEDVYFDNLVITLGSGPVLEETHYYPFGLTMEGISARAIGKLENKYLYNGKELQRGEFAGGGLEWYDYGARMYDGQIGRWWVVDPLQQKYPFSSPYSYVLNNPMLFVDPDGRDVILYNTEGAKVATITKAGTIIEKGMEKASILSSYNSVKKYLQKSEGSMFSDFEKSTKTLVINETSNPNGAANFQNSGFGNTTESDLNKDGKIDIDEITGAEYSDDKSWGKIEWNPLTGGTDAEGNNHSPALIFSHELKHAWHFKSNLVQFIKDFYNKQPGYDNAEEKRAIDETNEVSKKLGNGDGGNGTTKKRTSHGAKGLFNAESPISNKERKQPVPVEEKVQPK